MSDHCEKWRDEILRLIDGRPAGTGAGLDEHLRRCPSCRQYQEALLDDHQQLAGFTASLDGVASRIEDRVIRKITAADNTEPEGLAEVIPLRRRIMSVILTKYAAAAAVILALVSGYSLFNQSTDSGLLWAEVLKQVTAARSVIFQTVDESGEEVHKIRIRRSADDCSVFDASIGGTLEMRMIKDPTEQVALILYPEIKRYSRYRLDEERAQTEWKWEDPGRLVERILSTEHSDLGQREIDGVQVVGIETNDPDFIDGISRSRTLRLWVNVETRWPVMMEFVRRDAEGNELAVQRYGQFSWNTELEEMVVSTETPADYRHIADFGLFDLDEANAVAGLELYANAMDRYPARLDQGLDDGMELNEKLMEDRKPSDPMQDPTGVLKTFGQAGMFYNQLNLQQREVIYHGDRVSPGEAHLVLWRWREDDGNFRVIYGDLTVETVSRELLEQLEAGF